MEGIDRFGVQPMGLPPEVAAYVDDHAAALLRGVLREAIAASVRVTEAGVCVDWQGVMEALHVAQRQPEPLYDGEDDGPLIPPFGVRMPSLLPPDLPVFRRYPMSARSAAATDLNSAA